jgi:hypothetical protein
MAGDAPIESRLRRLVVRLSADFDRSQADRCRRNGNAIGTTAAVSAVGAAAPGSGNECCHSGVQHRRGPVESKAEHHSQAERNDNRTTEQSQQYTRGRQLGRRDDGKVSEAIAEQTTQEFACCSTREHETEDETDLGCVKAVSVQDEREEG